MSQPQRFVLRVEGWEWAAKAFEQLLAERDRLAIKLAEKADKP